MPADVHEVPPGYETATILPSPPAKRRAWVVVVTLAVVLFLVIPLMTAVILQLFVAQIFFIPSGSMEPTLKIGDRIIVDKLSYDHHAVDTGDIVVFARPTKTAGGHR